MTPDIPGVEAITSQKMVILVTENKQWIWLTIDPNTKQIMGLYEGDSSKKGAKKLFNSLPEKYRKKAQLYTDDYDFCK